MFSLKIFHIGHLNAWRKQIDLDPSLNVSHFLTNKKPELAIVTPEFDD